LEPSVVRILVVDGYEPWRRYVSSTLQKRPGLQVVGEAADGLEAVQRAKVLKPDLILLDIGLCKLNGIGAASRIRETLSMVKILMASQNCDADVVREVLSQGVNGYLLKMDAGVELLPAIEVILRGEKFVSRGVKRLHLSDEF
jgi:two-component system nitrate/nitrite response regulator NarL